MVAATAAAVAFALAFGARQGGMALDWTPSDLPLVFPLAAPGEAPLADDLAPFPLAAPEEAPLGVSSLRIEANYSCARVSCTCLLVSRGPVIFALPLLFPHRDIVSRAALPLGVRRPSF